MDEQHSSKMVTSLLKKTVFLTLAAAFFFIPLSGKIWGGGLKTLADHAPGLAVIAGILFACLWGNPFQKITSQWTSPLLGVAIVGMGFGMDLGKVLQAGANGFLYTLSGIILGLGLGALLGRWLKIPKNVYTLIGVGTSICGGSAIAAAAPVLKAKAQDVALASAVVFTLNAVALLLFPVIGKALGMTQGEFGYFAALAIHDTSSVVGASCQYGDLALEVGTTVKLARALWIVPVTLFLAWFVADREEGEKANFKLKIPWFIPGFILAAAFVSLMPWEGIRSCGGVLKDLSKYLLVVTLFFIGSNLSREKLKELGFKPVLHGVILWLILAALWGCVIGFHLIQCPQ